MGLDITWDEPEGCTSPRGWALLNPRAHPDRNRYGFDYLLETSGRACGNYLQYTQERGPAGESIHAVAYLFRIAGSGSTSHMLGFAWFFTVADAKAWIERAVADALEREPVTA